MEAAAVLAELLVALRRGRREHALEQAFHYWIDRPGYEPALRQHWPPVRRLLTALRAAEAVLAEAGHGQRPDEAREFEVEAADDGEHDAQDQHNDG